MTPQPSPKPTSALRSEKGSEFLSSVALFVAIPAMICLFLLNSFFSHGQEASDRHMLRSSRKILGEVANLLDLPSQVQNTCRGLHELWIRGRLPPEKWSEVLARIRERRGLNVDVYVYNHLGDLVTPKSLKVRARAVFQKFIMFLHHGQIRFLAGQINSVKTFFGQGWTSFPTYRGQIQKFRGMGRDGFLFWDLDPFSASGGLLLIVWEKPDPMEVLRSWWSKASAPPPPFKNISSMAGTFSCFAQNQQGACISLWGTLASETQPAIARAVKNSHEPMVRFQRQIWTSLNFDEFSLFLGNPEVSAAVETSRRLARVLLLLFTLGGLFFEYRRIIQKRDSYFSLRYKTIFFFLYILLIPFTGALILSFQTLRETERVLLENLRVSGLETLKAIDDGFLNEPRRLQKIFDRFYELLKIPRAHKNVDRAINRFLWANSFSSLEIRDGAGKMIFELGGKISREPAIRTLVENAAIESIRRYVPERFVQGKVAPKDEVGNLGQAMLNSSDLGISGLFEYPGALKRTILPKVDFFLYGNIFHDTRLPGVAVALAITTAQAKEEYLKRSLSRLKKQSSEQMKTFAIDENGNQWIPLLTSNSGSLRRFSQRLRMAGEPQSDRIIWKKRPWIAVGYPGKHIPEFHYVGLLSADLISKPLAQMRRQIYLGICLAAFLTLLLGWVLGNTFLVPIGDLGKGIQALQHKDVRFRIDQFSRDELGDLSHAFNAMMENMEEFSSGNIVQKQLIPTSVLSHGEYRVFGISKPANHLGGDYFDYISLDQHHFLVLIGDVAGHGIPAALIMAMSKAIVATLPMSEGGPRELLTSLNLALFQVMRGKLLMTMGVFLVNTENHEITYFHQGHTFPLIWNSREITEYAEARGLPIGRNATVSLQASRLVLPRGSRLVLYSDGLIESLGTSGAVDSYTLFRQFVFGLGWLPLSEICHAIMKEHPFFITGSPQPDDFTVVVMERA